MLIASPDAILAVHGIKWPRPEYCHYSTLLGRPKFRSWKLQNLYGANDLINPASTLLADSHFAHQGREPFVSRLVTINQSLNCNDWLSRIANFESVCKNLDHYRYAADVDVLVNQCIGSKLANDDLRHQL